MIDNLHLIIYIVAPVIKELNKLICKYRVVNRKLLMNVPRFPAPPSPLDCPSSTAIKTITNEILLSPDDDYLPYDNDCNQSNDNLSATKKRVYRLARLTRLGNSTVHPRRIAKKGLKAHDHSSRIIEITLKMTERRVDDNDDDDDVDVVCAASTYLY